MKKQDWEAGYKAGYAKEKDITPPGIDGLAWSSGYVEGKGDKQMGKPSALEKARKRDEGLSR